MAVSGRNRTRIAAEWQVRGHLMATDIIRYIEGELSPDDKLSGGESIAVHLHRCPFCHAKVEAGELVKQHWTEENLIAAGRSLLHGHRPALWNALAKRSAPWRRGLVPALTVFRPELKPFPEPGAITNTRDANIGDDFEFTLAVTRNDLSGDYLLALLVSDYPTHQLRVLACQTRQRLAEGRIALHGAQPLKVEEPRGVQVFHALVVEQGPQSPSLPLDKLGEESLDAFLSGLLIRPSSQMVCVFEAALRVHGPRSEERR